MEWADKAAGVEVAFDQHAAAKRNAETFDSSLNEKARVVEAGAAGGVGSGEACRTEPHAPIFSKLIVQ